MRRKIHLLRAITMLIPLLTVVPRPAFSQCEEYEVLIKDGLKAGQSLAVRRFAVGESLTYQKESLEALQTTLAASLVASLERLHRFRAVVAPPDSDTLQTDLVMEGMFTRADRGSKVRRAWLTGSERAPAKVRVSGVIKRVPDGASVFWFHCPRAEFGAFPGFGVWTLLLGESGNNLLRSVPKRLPRRSPRPSPEATRRLFVGNRERPGEGRWRSREAAAGILDLARVCHATVVVPNGWIVSMVGRDAPYDHALQPRREGIWSGEYWHL